MSLQDTRHGAPGSACGPLTDPGDPEPAEPANGPHAPVQRLTDEQFQLRVTNALHRSAEEYVSRVIDKLEHLAGLDVAKEPGPKGDGIRWTLRMVRSAVKGRRP